MGNPGDFHVWVLVDESILVSAFHELSADGVPQIDTFPPADSSMPAATVLATAASAKVSKAGIEMIVDARSLDMAVAVLRSERSFNSDRIDAFTKEVQGKLIVDRDAPGGNEGESVPTFETVVDYWRPDVLVTLNPQRRGRHTRDPVAVSPAQWIRRCIEVVRTS